MTHTSISSETLTAFRSALADRYVLQRELGQGGMATVYLAQDVANDRLVAVKVLLPELAASLGADRFLREIEVGRTLQHPNIVGVLDSGSADGRLFYTMPYVDGASLRDRLDREKQLSIDDAIALTRQIAEALGYAHAKGVIHRDIKPENILLSEGRALVADFGVARAVSVAGGERLTRTGMAVGTPTYMSPEQAMGSKDVTPESDIYSLGCMVYEMLAGQPPFSGPTAMAILARHSLDSVPSLKIVRSTVPDAVEDAIVRALAKVPADRFRSALDFADSMTDTAGAAARRLNSIRASAIPAETMTDSHVARRKRGKLPLIVAAIAAPLLIAGAWFGLAGRNAEVTDGRLAALEANNIAVLYFDDRSADQSLKYLSDGLTEALIRELGMVKGLSVISRNGVLPYKGKSVAADSIARALSVGTVVSGTVATSGDKLRVTVELIDARTNKSLGSKEIEKSQQETFALQDELVQEVGEALRKKLGEQVQVLTSRAGTRNAAAWQRFQLAKQTVTEGDSLVRAGDVTAAAASMAQADQALAGVIAADPKWAAPGGLRGMLAYRRARLALAAAGGVTAAAALIDSGLASSERAVAASPSDADALEARGTLRYLKWLLNLAPAGEADRLLAAAEADLTGSITANPVQASALNTVSHLYAAMNRAQDANRAARRALEADPYLVDANKTQWRLFETSLELGAGVQSRKACDEGAQRFPNDYRFAECRLWLLTLPDQVPPPTAPAIWKAYEGYLSANKVDAPEFAKRKGFALAGVALLRAGLEDSARAVIGRAPGNESIDPGGDLLYLEAMARSQLGDRDRAISLLGRFYVAHPQKQTFAGRDESWWFRPLQDEPRYRALVGTAK